MACAILRYQQGQDKPRMDKRAGLHTVCRDVEKEYFRETGKRLTLNHNTLCNLANGGRMKSDVNAE